MRADMARVIVERPRRGGVDRPGRAVALDDAPALESMRRPYRGQGGKDRLQTSFVGGSRYL